MSGVIRVTVWNEYEVERIEPEARAAYPRGIHEEIAAGLRGWLGDRVAVRTATLDQPEHGLPLHGPRRDGCPGVVGAHGP